MGRAQVLEPLEGRTLLSGSATVNAAVPKGFSKIVWQGQASYTKTNQWILRAGNLQGNAAAQVAAVGKVLKRNVAGVSVARYLGGADFVVKTAKPMAYAKIFAACRHIPGFASVEPDFLVRIAGTIPNDPGFLQQYALQNTGQKYGSQAPGTPGADISAPAAWDVTQGSSDVVVAVIDTGVQLDHPDLAANIWTVPGGIPGDGYIDDVHGWNFVNNTNNPTDDQGHGTMVAGIIGAIGNNGVGVTGVNWNVKILPLKFIDSTGNGDTAGAIAALNYCITLKRLGVNIVASNNSWGGSGYSRALQRAIVDFGNAGMIFVAAAGNNGQNLDLNPFYPAAFNLPNMISVAGTTNTDALWSGSDFGPASVDLGAPGTDIYSTARFSSYTDPAFTAGTSFAAPFVTGVVALASAISPKNVGYATIRNAVLNGGDPVPALAGITVTGKRLDAYGTLLQLPMQVLSATPGNGQVVTSPPTDFTVHFSHPVAAATLDAGDLTVNGIPADSVSSPDSRTAVFHFNTSPVVNQGLQTVAMAAGAVERQGDAAVVQALATTFRYDALVMQVTASTPASGSTLPPPLTEIDLTMNEAVDPASVRASDLALSQGSVLGAALSPTNPQIVQFLVSEPTEANLSMSLAAGALTDQFGNPCAAWNGSLVLDVTTAPFPAPLAPAPPLGSHVHAGSLPGMVNVPGDVDVYTIDLAPGQRASIKVTGTGGLSPSLEVRDPSAALVASGSAPANGTATATLIPVSTAGVYSITIAGLVSTWGPYTLQIILNATIETELSGGPANNTRATAQTLDGTFQPLPLGGQAAAVWGRTDVPAGILPAEVEPNDSTALANDASLNFLPAAAGVYQIGVKASSSTPTDTDYYNLGPLAVGDLLTLAMSGQASFRGTLADPYMELYRWNGGAPLLLAVSDDDGPGDEGPGGDSFIYRYAVTTPDAYYVLARSFYPPGGTGTYDLAATIENVTTPPGTSNPTTAETEPNTSFATATDLSQAWRAVQYVSTTSGLISSQTDQDYYSYTLHAGDLLSVYVKAIGASSIDSAVSLLNSAGTVIAADDGFTNYLNADSGIWSYVVPADGVYYVEVYSVTGFGPYTASVYLSAATPPPQPAPVPDFYSVSLLAGEHVSAAVSTAQPGAIALELQDSTGTPMVDGVAAANASGLISDFVAPSTGTYYLRVQGDRNLDYVLWISRDSGVETDPNNTPAQATPLAASGTASGYLAAGDEDWYSFTASAGDVVQVKTATPGGPPGEYQNLLDPAVEVYDAGGTLIASDSSSAGDGRNALLNFTAAASGTYRVRVLPQAGVGEYQLAVADFNAGLPGGFGNDVYQVQLAADGVTLNILANGQLTWSAPAALLTGLTINDPAGNDTLSVQTPLGFVPRLLGDGADTLAFLAGTYALPQDLGAGGRNIGLCVSGATVTSSASQHLRGVTIGDGGMLRMAAGPTAILRTGSLYMSGSGILDMGNHDLVLDYAGASPIDRLRQYLYNGSAGARPAIVTSAATPDGHPAALGAVDNQQIHQLAWDGETLSDGTNFSQVLIKFTYLGDVNLDGRVDASDYLNVFANMSAAGEWFQGDVDYDGVITAADAAIVAANLGAGTGAGMGL
ncbi:MAG: S8 family serine peptidase [Tepidisphaerales bacterium]